MPSAPKWTYTRSASTMGVGDAQLFLGFVSVELRSRNSFGVHHFASCFDVKREGAKRCAVLSAGRGHPDAAANHHRRRPPAPWNRDLPDHIPRLAPLERQTMLGRDSLASRATEFRPVLSLGRGPAQREQKQDRQCDSSEHDGTHSIECCCSMSGECCLAVSP